MGRRPVGGDSRRRPPHVKPRSVIAQSGQLSAKNVGILQNRTHIPQAALHRGYCSTNTNPISSASRTRRPLHIVLCTAVSNSAQTSSASRKRLDDSQQSSRHRAPTPCVGRCAVAARGTRLLYDTSHTYIIYILTHLSSDWYSFLARFPKTNLIHHPGEPDGVFRPDAPQC